MKSLIDMYTDQQFVLPAIETAELHAKCLNEVYFYIFSQNPGNELDFFLIFLTLIFEWLYCTLCFNESFPKIKIDL